MSDIADRSDQIIGIEVATSLAMVRKAQDIAPDGHCCFCDEPLPHPARFCNVDCRDDYDRELAALRRAGR
ncbi:hypothetical protein [Paraherbaspirillum soli]|uniref:DUF2116 family Zn-ribbon domain-containing protein n=1 Tax=Paraherbaspirillum soli TaxID=631222 RepID=A0ABW0MC75_9BURK